MSIKKKAVPARRKTAVPSAPTGVVATLAQRGQVHGDFTENAHTAQTLKQVEHAGVVYDKLSLDQREVSDNVLQKVARIFTDNQNHKDHWHDIQGYAKLAEDRLE